MRETGHRGVCLPAAAILAAMLPATALAQHMAGAPDLGFGLNGRVGANIGSPAGAVDVAVDAEGRIVVAGYRAGSGGYREVAVLRYLPHGSPDYDFGGGDGLVATSFRASTNSIVRALVIQPDGKILVAGSGVHAQAPAPLRSGVALARYTPDGWPDLSFGTWGEWVAVLPYATHGHALALQPDGKIVVAGVSEGATTDGDPCVTRHHPDGSLDTSFGTGGIVRLAINGDQSLTGVALTATGRILLSGRSGDSAMLVRLRSNGELDETFGSFGFVTTVNSPDNAILVQPDGRVVVPGSWNGTWGGAGVAVARYHGTGSLDQAFAGDGVANSEIVGYGRDAVLQRDGRIVVAGYRGLYDDLKGVLWRVTAGGASDPTFYVEPESAAIDQDIFVAVALQPDGKIVAAGAIGDGGGFSGVLVARFHGDPPDLIFRDGFDLNDLSAWSASATDSGDLSTSHHAGVEPTVFGLRAVVDDTNGLYVQDDSPIDEPRYRARFYVDPGDFDPGEAEAHRRTRTFIAFQENPNRRVAAVVLRRVGGAYSVMARARLDDDRQANTPFQALDGAPHSIELDLRRATGPGASDGSLQLWVDGASVATLDGLDNDLAEVDFVRLGALSLKSGAGGTLSWDEFESRRETYIGPVPLPPPPAGADGAVR